MNVAEVAALFKTIKRAYPHFDGSRENVIFWHGYLKDTPAEVAERNLDRHIASDKFPPTIADLKRPLQPEETDADRFHGTLKKDANEYLDKLDEWRRLAAPPTPDQRERVMGREPKRD